MNGSLSALFIFTVQVTINEEPVAANTTGSGIQMKRMIILFNDFQNETEHKIIKEAIAIKCKRTP